MTKKKVTFSSNLPFSTVKPAPVDMRRLLEDALHRQILPYVCEALSKASDSVAIVSIDNHYNDEGYNNQISGNIVPTAIYDLIKGTHAVKNIEYADDYLEKESDLATFKDNKHLIKKFDIPSYAQIKGLWQNSYDGDSAMVEENVFIFTQVGDTVEVEGYHLGQ